jgi:hypothetical protein
MTDRRDDIRWFQGWYIDQCNGDWEHQHGVRIGTLDNPGWTLTVDLEGTSLERKPMTPLEIHRSEHDWIHAAVKDRRFEGAGGPDNLVELIRVFRLWITEQPSAERKVLAVRGDRLQQKQIAQDIVNEMLLGADVKGVEFSDKYIVYFYNPRSGKEYMLSTLWNFQILPQAAWPEGLTPVQKQTLELQQVHSKRIQEAECQTDGSLIIRFERGMELQIHGGSEYPNIDRLWTLTELGATVAGGATKILVDAEGGFTIWTKEHRHEN